MRRLIEDTAEPIKARTSPFSARQQRPVASLTSLAACRRALAAKLKIAITKTTSVQAGWADGRGAELAARLTGLSIKVLRQEHNGYSPRCYRDRSAYPLTRKRVEDDLPQTTYHFRQVQRLVRQGFRPLEPHHSTPSAHQRRTSRSPSMAGRDSHITRCSPPAGAGPGHLPAAELSGGGSRSIRGEEDCTQSSLPSSRGDITSTRRARHSRYSRQAGVKARGEGGRNHVDGFECQPMGHGHLVSFEMKISRGEGRGRPSVTQATVWARAPSYSPNHARQIDCFFPKRHLLWGLA
jgi:hypothetical protein